MAFHGIRVKYRGDGTPWLNASDAADILQGSVLGTKVPEMEQYRRYFGRALTPATIEQVVRQAELGYMRDLTDLINETIFIDPHFGSCTGKRFRQLAGMKVKVTPASGDGIDPKIASDLAEMVRQQVAWIPNFKQAILRLNWGHCHGRAALEKMWRQNPPGGKVRWRVESLNWIHPRRLAFGPERELRVRDSIFQGLGFEAVGLDLRQYPGKFIAFTPQLFNEYPEREGFGPRGLYWSFHKRFGQRERMILLEVFGKPWRIAYTENLAVNQETLETAADMIDNMGGNATARLPPGVKVETTQPGERSGQNHRDAIADSNDELSKLILGTTRTTDAKPNAIGSAGDEVGQDEQSSVVAADGWNVSDCLTEGLAADIVALNAGPEVLDHCPRIEIAYELPKNRGVEAEVATKTLSIGIPLKEDEVYERTGWTKPQPGDRVVRMQPQAPAAAPGAQPAQPGSIETMPGDEANDEAGGGSPLGGTGASTIDPGQALSRGGGLDPLAVARAAGALELLAKSSQN